jgi:hypothetical protein
MTEGSLGNATQTRIKLDEIIDARTLLPRVGLINHSTNPKGFVQTTAFECAEGNDSRNLAG